MGRMDLWMNSATEEQDWALPSFPAERRGIQPCAAHLLHQQSLKAKAARSSFCTVANVFGFPFAVHNPEAKIFLVQGLGELLSILHLRLLQAPRRCHP